MLEIRDKEKNIFKAVRKKQNKKPKKSLPLLLENNDLKVDKFYFRNKGG